MTVTDRLCPPKTVYVLVLDQVHALDFGGPVQAAYEAAIFGAPYRLEFVGPTRAVRSAQGYTIADLAPLPDVSSDSWVIVPGTDSRQLENLTVPVDWLREVVERGVRVSSICTGAFSLARAGLLKDRTCTTHWKLVERLRAEEPKAIVRDNCLYVEDGNIVTSAGVASGIDMALAVIEKDCGPRIAAQTAREMVVYLRRSSESEQQSAYLDHRAHLHPGVHRVQDWIIANPDRRATVGELAELAAVSPRHLTRVFRQATGITLNTFAQMVRLEVAGNLVGNVELSVEDIAGRCGFKDARQLRRLWRRHHGKSIRETRRDLVRAHTISHPDTTARGDFT